MKTSIKYLGALACLCLMTLSLTEAKTAALTTKPSTAQASAASSATPIAPAPFGLELGITSCDEAKQILAKRGYQFSKERKLLTITNTEQLNTANLERVNAFCSKQGKVDTMFVFMRGENLYTQIMALTQLYMVANFELKAFIHTPKEPFMVVLENGDHKVMITNKGDHAMILYNSDSKPYSDKPVMIGMPGDKERLASKFSEKEFAAVQHLGVVKFGSKDYS